MVSCIFEIFNLEKEANSLHMVERIVQQLRDFVKRKKIIENETQPRELQLVDVLENNLKELYIMLNDMEENSASWTNIGKSWIHIGVVQFLLFSIFEMVDPVLKMRFKKLDCEDDVSALL